MQIAKKNFTQQKFFSNTFEIKFKKETFKYAVEIDPNPGANAMSVIGKALRANSTVLKEKYGNSYIFINNAIYSPNIAKGSEEIKVLWDEVEYTILST